MAGFEISGSLISKAAKVTGQSQKGVWEKQEFVIQTLDKDYPKNMALTCWGATIEKLRPFKKNEVIKVSFSAESKERNGRWYTELRAFKIESGETLTPREPVQRQNNPPQPKQVYEPEYDEGDTGDLPF